MEGSAVRVALLAVSVALCAGGPPAARAGAQVVAPGFTCETYASLEGPVSLDFDAAGNLFAGHDVPGGMGGDSVKVRRIGPGGNPVVEFGASAIPDPDGVLVDDAGTISGTAGAVVVCGDAGGAQGQILAVLPDESIVTLFGPSSVLSNPNFMALGRDGLLLSDSGNNKVFEFIPPGPPTVLIDSPSPPYHLAVDGTNRIFVAHADGVIRIYDPDGALLDGAFATGLGNGPSIAFGRGGAFGADLYALNPDTGELVRIAAGGGKTVIGTGFPASLGEIEFGPDQALYVAAYADGQVLRVAPVPPPAITSFFLPKKVKALQNAASPANSTLVSLGIFDTGPDAPDFASAATLDVGGLQFDIPGLTQRGRSFTFAGSGVAFSIAPNPYGSSRAKFKLKFTGDFSGKVALNGPLLLHFKNAVTDGGGTVNLGGGVFGLGKVRGALVEPNLFVVRAHANLKGLGKDALAVIVGLAAGGVAPPSAANLTIGFAGRVSATISPADFTRKGDADVFSGNAGGITKVTVDYAREEISIVGKGLDLGTFAQGGNSVLISVGLGGDQRSVLVRMGRIGNTMKY